jgi:signal transduction histidine kinase/ligand-binding sensor domain-containing protein/DNA-binding response OmpR family regulator
MQKERREEFLNRKLPISRSEMLNVAKHALSVVFTVITFLATAQVPSASFVPVAPEVLANSSVRCFFRDSNGYMWIGTEDALIRYDGRNAFRYIHDPNDKNAIAHNTINTIVESSDKKLWIGTARGLCIYDRELDNFINVDSIKGNRNYLNNRYITHIEFDSEGRTWIGTHEGGINIYDPAKKQFTYIIDPPQGGILPATNFINILLNIGNTMWCASKWGLSLYNTSTLERLSVSDLSSFSNIQITSIAREKSNDVLVASLEGQVTRVHLREGRYLKQELLSGEELGESSNRILALSLDNRGDILIGGQNSGFNFINKKSHELYRFLAEDGNPKRLPTNSIQSIYADNLGLIWIGTLSHGAFVFDSNRKKFEMTESSNSDRSNAANDIRGFAEDKEGNIWTACYGIGLAKIDPRTNTLQQVPKINNKLGNRNVTSIIYDKHGDLWLGTAAKGVYKINPHTQKIVHYSLTSDGFGNDQVFRLYEDRNGNVWAGTWGSGLFVHDTVADKFVGITEYDRPNHIPNTAYVTDIVEDSAGTFWIGTLYGLYELKRQSDHSFTYRLHLPEQNSLGIKGPQIEVIVEDQKQNLWIGTPDGLHFRKKGESQFSAYLIDKDEPFNAIRSILVDKNGNAWIGGNNGLFKFDMSAKTFINYTRDDGLSSNYFNNKACLANSEGKFFFGGTKGFDSFFPDSISTTSSKPRIILSDLKINNQSVKPGSVDSPLRKHISLTSELNLTYDQRSFVIDFVALDYNRSSSYKYCYKLEGFDKDWNCGTSNYSATYTNIDPGDYVFLVKAANRDGVWVDQPLKLNITIQQVFWKTWWAVCIYTLFFLLLLYFLLKIRIERLKLKNEIMFEKLKWEHEQRLSESKTQFFTNVAHEFRTPLSLILIPLESLMGTNEVPSALRDRIYTAYKNASRMGRLVNELLDFNKLEAGNLQLNVQHGELVQFIVETASAFNDMAAKRKIRFSVNSDTPTIMGWFDRDKLERMIFNILSNAFKFTADEGEIKLRIGCNYLVVPDGTLRRSIELVIEDNGIGILPEELPHIFEKFYQAKSSFKISSPGTGIGLSFTKALVELHHGTITAESRPGHSTVFTILLPIDSGATVQEEEVITPPEVVFTQKPIDLSIAPTDLVDQSSDDLSEKSVILVAEDNLELREYLVAELQKEFSVLEAGNGEEGLTLAIEKGPDLIISDIMMPVKDGIDFCDEIKSDLQTSHIPFILLTAKATIEDQIKGIRTGADLYVAKPFNIQFLIAHIQQIIASRKKLYSRFSQDVYLIPGKAATNALDQEFLQKAIDYIVANLQESQLSVDSIADLFNLSRMQVYRKIKALTGKSVVEFIKMVRMKQAIKLMDSHKLTLSEIAFEVGFNSASYFTRCFKEEFGKTPSEYLDQV